jgi:hypothetical protein
MSLLLFSSTHARYEGEEQGGTMPPTLVGCSQPQIEKVAIVRLASMDS